MVRPRSVASAWVAALAIIAGASAPSRGGFAIRDLGVIVSSGTSGATAINADGQAAGVVSTQSGQGAAARSSAGGGFQPIALPPGAVSSVATSIGGGGAVAGYYDDANGVRHGFYAPQGASATAINPLTAGTQHGTFTQANGINSSGQVVGMGDLPNGAIRAFVATGSGSPTVINPLGAGTFNQANGINDGGTVVGSSETSRGGLVRAFYTDGNSRAFDLTNRNGAGNFSYNTYATAIANDGDIVGHGDVGLYEHAFYASGKGGALVDLGSLSANSSSMAEAVNNMAMVVGEAALGSGQGTRSSSLAFLWAAPQGMVDLNTLLSPADHSHWSLTQATGINDSDQISGVGYLDGVLHGYVLTPIAGQSIFTPAGAVPTPPALVLSGLGLAIASGWARLRRGRSVGRAGA